MIVDRCCARACSLVLGSKNTGSTTVHDRLSQRHVVYPVWDTSNVFRQENGATVDKFRVLVTLVKHTGILKVGDPLGWSEAVTLHFQLDFQDGMWETMNLVLLENPALVTVPHLHILQVIATLRDHAKVGIKRDTNGGIKWNLKGGTHALRSHCRYQLFTDGYLRTFAHERFPFIHFLLTFALLQHFLFLLGNWILSVQENGNFILSESKTFLDRDFARPLFVVCLTLHKNQFRVTRTIPTQSKRNGTGGLVQTTMVKFQLIIVQIDTVGKLRI
mmetsp:Transcript_2308/g.4575  ORF Transcript_2308/g.4575 Transcript_2308/m.4575 type:complete len:274 (-) Transcript_2308:856-1677(-)